MYHENYSGGQLPGREVARLLKGQAEKLGIKVKSYNTVEVNLGEDNPAHVEEITLLRGGKGKKEKSTVIIDYNQSYSDIPKLIRTSQDYTGGLNDLSDKLARDDGFEMPNLERREHSKQTNKKNVSPTQVMYKPVKYSGNEVAANIKTHAKKLGLEIDSRKNFVGPITGESVYEELRILNPKERKFGMRQEVGNATIWHNAEYTGLGGHIRSGKEGNHMYAKLEESLKGLDYEKRSVNDMNYNKERRVSDTLTKNMRLPRYDLEKKLE
ncbi:MAG: hypothetical protein ACQESF_05300 [Nanobdellota archaeon]